MLRFSRRPCRTRGGCRPCPGEAVSAIALTVIPVDIRGSYTDPILT